MGVIFVIVALPVVVISIARDFRVCVFVSPREIHCVPVWRGAWLLWDGAFDLWPPAGELPKAFKPVALLSHSVGIVLLTAFGAAYQQQ